MRAHTASRIAAPALPYRRYVALAIFAVPALPALALDYSASGSIDTQYTHNDNLRMSSHDSDKVSVDKYLVTPIISLNGSSETTTLGLNSIFYFNHYSQSQYNSNDMNIGLAFAHQFENSSIGLNANLVRDSTITSEQLSSGVIGDRAERAERYVVSPSWTYQLNETNMLDLQGTYTKQDYSVSTFTAYDNIDSNVNWIHIVDERMKLILSGQYSHYQSDDIGYPVPLFTLREIPTLEQTPFGDIIVLTDIQQGHFGQQSYSSRTRNKGGQIGVDYQWSEQTLIQARIGRSNSTTDYPTKTSPNFCADQNYLGLVASFPQLQPYLGSCDNASTNDHVSTALLVWNWNNENNTIDVSGSKQTQPTSNGYTVDATRISSNWNYRLTELDQISANLLWIRNRAVGSDSGSRVNSAVADRDYQSATVSYRHQFGENWFTTASYTYNHQQYSQLDSNSVGNVWAFTVRYRPQAWHWSR